MDDAGMSIWGSEVLEEVKVAIEAKEKDQNERKEDGPTDEKKKETEKVTQITEKIEEPVPVAPSEPPSAVEKYWNYAAVAISSSLIVGGIITLILIFVLQDRGIANFVRYKKELCAQNNPSIVDINICAGAVCTFDPSLCDHMCPFAYYTDDSGCPASCECAEKGIYQGDIRFDESEVYDMAKIYGYVNDEQDFEVLSGAVKANARLWKEVSVDGRYKIPYVMSPELKRRETWGLFKRTANRISTTTCVDFVPRTTEEEYVEVVDDGTGCSSSLGRTASRRAKISLAKECSDPQAIQHTLTHLMGFEHEHVRPDRDAYIEILTENIKPDYLAHFRRLRKYEVPRYNMPYDIDSIMHYGSSSFAKSRDLNSFVIRNTKEKRIERKKDSLYSERDVVEIDMAYGCMDDYYADPGWTNWDSWTSCDSTCGHYAEKHRYRKCEDSIGRFALGCAGDSHLTKRCVFVECPFEDYWLPWGPYSNCVGPCGSGTKTTRRKCSTEGKCGTWNMEVVECDSCGDMEARYRSGGSGQYGMWMSWSACSAPCDGQRKRKKRCGRGPCEEQIESCNVGLCNFGQRRASRVMTTASVAEVKGVTCKLFLAEVGDFDGDGKKEILCWEPIEGKLSLFNVSRSGETEKVTVATKFSCQRYYNKRNVGDFNGDGKLDLMCGDMFKNSTTKVYLSKGAGEFGVEIPMGDFCNGRDDRKHIVDLDNDKDSDILCKRPGGRIEVLIN